MREILFRGKRLDNGEWVEGYFVKFERREIPEIYTGWNCYTLTPECHGIEPSTVGQHTGSIDKNGKKIFEDDIIRVKCSIRCPIGVGNSFRIGTYDIDYIASVIFDDCRFCLAKANGEVYEIPLSSENIEVIGNIHDNQELLEVTK